MSSGGRIIGVDLGTTHSVCAYTHFPDKEDEGPEIRIFGVAQLVEAGEVHAQVLLPSFLFIPGAHDAPEKGLTLPWTEGDSRPVVGEYARKRGAELPHRLVSSAKSWLSYSGVDRSTAVLPWGSPPEVEKISPVEASSMILKHLRDAWNHEVAMDDPGARFERQEIYLTVPASFDAVARELTVQAARSAGLDNLTLLEEPQAAFYAWIHKAGESWRKAVKVGQTILVFDVGGGTTDLSLIQAAEEQGELVLNRVAVGDHILLGGDNMDLTLAYKVRAKLAEKGVKLDAWQFQGLRHACRAAKERLLNDSALESEPIVVLGRGSSLIGSSIRTELTREETQKTIVDGFFPFSEASETPRPGARVGMKELGLPYEADPAVTRHLAGFLGRHTRREEGAVPFPSAVLFNGGVMKAAMIRGRVLDVMGGWRGEGGVEELSAADPDLAVALGAAYYGLARRGRGIRVRGGTARTYYIGVESAMPSVPGVPTPIKALCVVPFGTEEGTRADIQEKGFGLVVGSPAVFQLLASNLRKTDRAGEVIEDWAGEIEPVTEMEVHLPASAETAAGGMVPVWLQSIVTEVGTLEIWCVSREGGERWKLEFNLRQET